MEVKVGKCDAYNVVGKCIVPFSSPFNFLLTPIYFSIIVTPYFLLLHSLWFWLFN